MPDKDANSKLDIISILNAAEALSGEGRDVSAASILDIASGHRHKLPILRRIFKIKHRAHGDGFDDREEFLKGSWKPRETPLGDRPTCLTILDEISDINWSSDFECTRLVRSTATEQISEASYDFVMIETAWLGHEGDWIYAFTSPGLEHAHAQTLVAVLRRLRETSDKPIVIINKEDPLHFEKFLPVMKYADHILTTDAEMVTGYRERTDALSVTAMSFAANMALTNPVGRVNEPQETVCFAGSYYSAGYEERMRQMSYMLEPIIDAAGAIYDRQSLQDDPSYHFPERFRPFIRPAVKFEQMIQLYRRFRVFLNVNTIVTSPTMMARRVYELLASGTPLVSAPSRAMEEQFSGIVPFASNAREAKREVQRLLEDESHWWRTSQRGVREVTLKHQYKHRAALIRSVVWGEENEERRPLVSIVLSAERLAFLDRVVESVSKQTYPRIDLLVATGEHTPERSIAELRNRLVAAKSIEGIAVIKFPDSAAPGTRLIAAIDAAKGDYIAMFDEDNWYFPNYILDMMLTFEFSGADVAGKWSHAAWQPQNERLMLRNPGHQHRLAADICSSTIVTRKSWLGKVVAENAAAAEDLDIVTATQKAGGKIYSADHFNFIQFFSPSGENSSAREALAQPKSEAGRSNIFDGWEL